jgi:ankyrin repeat protein
MTYIFLIMLLNCGKTTNQNRGDQSKQEIKVDGNINDTNISKQKIENLEENKESKKDDIPKTSDSDHASPLPINKSSSVDDANDQLKNDLQEFLEAIKNGNIDKCSDYIQKYPETNVKEIKDMDGCPILFLVIKQNNEELLTLLLKCKPDPRLTYKAITPLKYAKEINSNSAIIKMLENYEVFYFVKHNYNNDLARCVQEYNYYNRMNDRSIDGFTLLMIASQNNNEDLIGMLIKSSVDPTLTFNKDGENLTALEYAKRNKKPNKEIIKKLEDYEKNYREFIKKLFTAAKENNLDSFNKLHLLVFGNPNVRNLFGCPLLVFAAANGSKDIVISLIQNSIPVDPTLTYQKNGKEFTALEYAKNIPNKNPEIIDILENYEKTYKSTNK